MTYKNDNRAARQQRPRRNNSQTQQRPQQQGGQNHWQRNYERYQALAAGDSDPVARENYWQHAEHFYRMMHEADTAAV